MNEPIDIEHMLRQAAPESPLISDLTIDRVHSNILRTVQFKKLGFLTLGAYFLISFVSCLILMIAWSLPWWLIGISFAVSALLFTTLWKSVVAVF